MESAASWALRIFEAATICIARVICAVLLTDRMRRRSSRGLLIAVLLEPDSTRSLPTLLELVGGGLELRGQPSLSAFSVAIFASSSGFRVVRNSVQRVWNSFTRSTATSSA